MLDQLNQQLFNLVFSVAGAGAGWWMKAIWDSLKELKAKDDILAKEVSDLKVLVAGQYVSTDSFNNLTTAIFHKLDRIEDKLDKKVDK